MDHRDLTPALLVAIGGQLLHCEAAVAQRAEMILISLLQPRRAGTAADHGDLVFFCDRSRRQHIAAVQRTHDGDNMVNLDQLRHGRNGLFRRGFVVIGDDLEHLPVENAAGSIDLFHGDGCAVQCRLAGLCVAAGQRPNETDFNGFLCTFWRLGRGVAGCLGLCAVSRLTGGAAITETTLAGARELLATAQTRKAGG